MKSLYLSFIALSFSIISTAQEICLVSADYIDGSKYIVSWEKPIDISNLDSVFIYRMVGTEPNFTKIGSQAMSALSIYKDLTSNTIDSTKYKISFVDNLGVESALSPWHQAVILDYNAGNLIWTKYKKENQVDESYIVSYECMRDQTGLGAYTSMGIWDFAGPNSWIDQEATFNPISTYYVEVMLPSCYISKANINTSRSNIKQQNINAEAGIQENTLLTLSVSPNPAESDIKITVDAKLLNAHYAIVDGNGKSMVEGQVASKEFTLNIQHFAKGTYFLTIENSSSVISHVFVKN